MNLVNAKSKISRKDMANLYNGNLTDCFPFPELDQAELEILPFEVVMDNQFENVLPETQLVLEYSTDALDHPGLSKESSTKMSDLETLAIGTNHSTSLLEMETQALGSEASSSNSDMQIQALRAVPPKDVLNMYAVLDDLEEPERSISRGNPLEENEKIEKVEGYIPDQKGAQNGPEQIEIRKGNLIQIALHEKLTGWFGISMFKTSPKYRQDTITSPEGLYPFSLKGPGKVLSLGKNEIHGAGPAFVQAVELENQDHLDISFDVISTNICSKYHHNYLNKVNDLSISTSA